jgi:hypothetical protein
MGNSKVVVMAWGNEIPLFLEAAAELGLGLRGWAVHDLKEQTSQREECRSAFGRADLALVHSPR